MSDTVIVEDQGGVRVLTLNRPTKLNAMNVELVDTLIGAVRAVDLDDAVAVVILTGAGRAFSAGADIVVRSVRRRPEREPERHSVRLQGSTCSLPIWAPFGSQLLRLRLARRAHPGCAARVRPGDCRRGDQVGGQSDSRLSREQARSVPARRST